MIIFSAKIDNRKSSLLVKEGIKTLTFRFLADDERICVEKGSDAVWLVSKDTGRRKWAVDDVHPVLPRRGQKAICRVKILAMRLTTVAQYTEQDIRDEGFSDEYKTLPPYPTRYKYSRVDRFRLTVFRLYPKIRDTRHKVGIAIRFEVTKDKF